MGEKGRFVDDRFIQLALDHLREAVSSGPEARASFGATADLQEAPQLPNRETLVLDTQQSRQVLELATWCNKFLKFPS